MICFLITALYRSSITPPCWLLVMGKILPIVGTIQRVECLFSYIVLKMILYEMEMAKDSLDIHPPRKSVEWAIIMIG